MGNRRFRSKAVKPEVILADLQQGLAAVEAYAEQHGSFSELVRDHYERVSPICADEVRALHEENRGDG